MAKHWYGKARYIVPLTLVALFFALWITADRLASWATRHELDNMKDFRGDFSSVHVSFFRLSYNISNLKIFEEPVHAGKPPLLFAQSIDAHLLWKELIRFHLGAQLKITKMKADIDIEPYKTPKERVAKEIIKQLPPPWKVAAQLRSLIPFRVERMEFVDAEIEVVDRREPNAPSIWIHDGQSTLENFVTREKLTSGHPATLAIRAMVQRSGKLDVFVSADLLAPVLTFAGEARLQKLKLDELYEFLVAKTGMKIPSGTFSTFASFKCNRGHLVGAVKPVLENVKIRAENQDLGTKIKAVLADTAIKIFSDRVPGRNAVAALIPIDGDLQNPKIELWPTVLSVVRNSFVEGLASGMTNLPLPEANHKEGVVRQARRALGHDSSPPVKVEPEAKKTSEDKK